MYLFDKINCHFVSMDGIACGIGTKNGTTLETKDGREQVGQCKLMEFNGDRGKKVKLLNARRGVTAMP